MDQQASTRAMQPEISGWQLDGGGLGDVANSVNLFRGDVNLPFKLLQLPGRSGLNTLITAFYSSNVHSQVETWNQDAPTQILGVGWSMPFEAIVTDTQQTGNYQDDDFYLVSAIGTTRLYRVDEVKDVIHFQLRTAPFWKIEYHSRAQRWIITKEDGSRSIYGEDFDEENAASAVQWNVKWGNWVGSSTQGQAQRYPTAWNLVRVESYTGDRMRFEYESTLVPIGREGLTATRSCRLKRIVDVFDQHITLNYKEKEPVEIQLPHIAPRSGETNAYQFQYETQYLDHIEVTNAQQQRLFHIQCEYDLFDVTSHEENGSDIYKKRYLRRVYQTSPDLEALPAIEFDYCRTAQDANPGALRQIVYPEGGTAAFTYTIHPLGEADTRAIISSPGTGYAPRVWHGPGYVVVTWYSERKQELVLDVYKWDGHWTSWHASIFDRFALEDFNVIPTGDFFVVSYKEARSALYKIHLYRESPYRFGTWTEYSFALTNDFTDLALAVGKDFVAAHSTQGVQLLIAQWDSFKKQWERTVLATGSHQRVALGATGNVCLAAFYTPNRLRLQLYYADANNVWKTGGTRTIDASVNWELTSPQTLWQVSPAFAAATFATQTLSDELTYQVAILFWREDFNIQDLRIYQGKQAADIENPVLFSAVNQALVGNAQQLYRYNGRIWDATSALNPRPGRAYRYTYGDDIVFTTVHEGGIDTYASLIYDPYQLQWRQGPIMGTHSSGDAILPPTVSADYATVDNLVYYRDSRNEWKQIHRLAPTMDLRTLQNHAPSYIAYELSGNKTTRIEFFKDGQPWQGNGRSFIDLAGERIFTGSTGSGMQLAGATTFITFKDAQFEDARALYLYYVADHSIEAQQTARAVTQLTIDTGYNATITSYDYDYHTGRYDPASNVVQFVKARSALVDPEGNAGSSEYVFFNGLHPDVPGVVYPDTDRFTNVKEFFSFVNGQLYQRHDRDAQGIRVGTLTNFFFVSDEASSDHTAGAAVQLRKQITGTDLRLFSLERASWLNEPLSEQISALKAIFQRHALPLTDQLTLSQENGERMLRLTDHEREKTYTLAVTDDSIDVYVAITRVTENEYNAQGQVARTVTANMNSRGQKEVIAEETRYAWETGAYPELVEANLFTLEAEQTRRNLTTERVISREATTYQKTWPDVERPLWASHKFYTWDGTPGTQVFDFTAWSGEQEPPIGWIKSQEVLSISNQGLALETTDIDAIHASELYDRRGHFVVATFQNTSLDEEEGSYYGFEEYEDARQWQLQTASSGPSARIERGDAFTGERRLSLPGNMQERTGLRATFSPANGQQRYLLSCWVKTPGEAAAMLEDMGWEITLVGTEVVRRFIPLPATGNKWAYFHTLIDPQAWDLPAFEQITFFAFNQRPDTEALVDNVCFVPFLGAMDATVVDIHLAHTTAEVSHVGNTRFLTYNRLQQPASETGVDGKVKTLLSRYLWRQGSSEAFNPADPNSILDVSARSGGFFANFRHGTEWQEHWSASNDWITRDGQLIYTGADRGTFMLDAAPTLADFALQLRLGVQEYSDQPVGVTIGTDMAIQWEDGNWHLLNNERTITQVPAATLARDWLLLVTRHSIQFYANDKLLLQQTFEEEIGGAPTFFTQQPIALDYLIVATDALMSTTYNDNAGNTIQSQNLRDSTVITEAVLYDPLGRQAITTRAAAAEHTLFGYRPQFVTAFDWQTGIMTGEVANYYPEDEGYPYTRTRFERSPLNRVLETGRPGKAFAIVGGGTDVHTTRSQYTSNGPSELLNDLPIGEYLIETIINPDNIPQTTISDREDRTLVVFTGSLDGPAEEKAVTRNFYDEAGNLTETWLPNYYAQNVTNRGRFRECMEYDFLGRVSSKQSPDTSVPARYVYDRAGRIRFALSANGQEKGYLLYWRYDLLGRLLEQGTCDVKWDERLLLTHVDERGWLPGVATWQKRFFYDGDGTDVRQIGRIVKSEVASSINPAVVEVTEQLRFTRGGALSERTTSAASFEDGKSYTTRFVYDNLGNTERVVYNATDAAFALTLSYQYNQLGQIVEVCGLEPGAVAPVSYAHYRYTADNRLEQEILTPGDGPTIVRTYAYDAPGSVTRIADPFFVEELRYTSGGYQDAGYYTGKIAHLACHFADSVGHEGFVHDYGYQFRYDALGRLAVAKNEVNDDWSFGLGQPDTFDANGNALRVQQGKTLSRYTYEAGTNKVLNTTGQETEAYQYDANGNVQAVAPRDISHIEYDRVGGVATEFQQPAGLHRFCYDAGDRRILKHQRDRSKLYLLDADENPLLEVTREATGSAQTICLLYGPSGLFGMFQQGKRRYILRDHLGSTRVIIDGQTAIAAYNYLPPGAFLGETFEQEGRVCDYLFTGQELDEQLGIYNYKARFYDVTLGRFYSADQFEQFASPYIYVGNDPVNLADPEGNFAWAAFLVALAIGAAIGGTLGGVTNLAANAQESSPSQKASYFFAGFGIGAVAGLATAGVGFATAGIGIGAGVTAGILTGGSLGAVEGYVLNGVNNTISGDRDFNEGAGLAAGIGALTGAVAGGIAGGVGARVGNALSRNAGRLPITIQLTPPRGPLPQNVAANRIRNVYRTRLQARRIALRQDLTNNANRLPGMRNGGRFGVIDNAAPANATRYRANNQGITSYMLYNNLGGPVRRVDLTGVAHGGVPTPHVLEYTRQVNNGYVRYATPRHNTVRPARWWEIP